MLDFNAAPLQPEQEPLPLAHAIEVPTGTGKTQIMTAVLSDGIASVGGTGERPVAFFAPTHRLAEDIAAQFIQHGIKARAWYGRDNEIPGSPGRLMCNNITRVNLALSAGLPVNETCCEHKKSKAKCPFFDNCAYQEQINATPDVWIMPHQNLWSNNPAIGEPRLVIIDESFHHNGIITPQKETKPIPISQIRTQLIPRPGQEWICADLDAYRNKLANALDKQDEGSLRREYLVNVGIDTDLCTKAISLEWVVIESYGAFGPDASDGELASFEAKLPTIRFHRRMARLWTAARDLLNKEDGASGRIFLSKNKDGSRVLWLSGLKPIVKQWRQSPTVMLDATLPALPILQAYYPQAEIVMQLDIPTPYANIRQAIYAPVSQSKLLGKGAKRNRHAIRRYILLRWLETGRQPTLVICQMEYEAWLKDCNLPDSIAIEHLNNIAGLDRYKDVRLLITIGRTLPSPTVVEAMAGALTGLEPLRCQKKDNGQPWYDREVRGALTVEGETPGITCDVHPDPIAEALRWRISRR